MGEYVADNYVADEESGILLLGGMSLNSRFLTTQILDRRYVQIDDMCRSTIAFTHVKHTTFMAGSDDDCNLPSYASRNPTTEHLPLQCGSFRGSNFDL